MLDLVKSGPRAEKPLPYPTPCAPRAQVVLDAICVHECLVQGRGGRFWPAPTFQVTAMDRPGEPLVAKSCTGCWTGVRRARGRRPVAPLRQPSYTLNLAVTLACAFF